jgi:hypothetical protein
MTRAGHFLPCPHGRSPQQRDNAEAAKDKKAAEEQFGQGLGRIAPKDADSGISFQRTSPPVT